MSNPSAKSGEGLLARRSGPSPLLALLCLAAAAWSAVSFAGDQRARSRADRFAVRFSLDRRQPVEVSAARVEPTADGALAVLGEAVLEDVLGPGAPANADPALRQLWSQATAQRGIELLGAQDVILDAVERRPGWPQHRLLLGRIALAGAGGDGRELETSKRWIVPLQAAVAGAPGLQSAWTILAGAYLDRWQWLEPATRADAPRVLRMGFFDPAFVSRSYSAAVAAVGGENAAKLLPDEPKPLREAAAARASAKDIPGVAALLPRLDRASRADREARLRRLAELRGYGDLDGVRSAGMMWMQDFSAYDFDDTIGRAQTARLLSLWPADALGSWRSDPRAELVRFFLNRREKAVSGAVLMRAVAPLVDVPDTARARIRLLAGDEPEALDIARSSSGAGSFEWSGFYLQLARARLERGDAAGARAALASVPPSAREGCDALLSRRDVDVALGDEQDAGVVNERLGWVEREAFPPDAWSAEGAISLCLVPEFVASRRLVVEIQSDGDAIARYGWNGGWLGSIRITPGTQRLILPVAGVAGRQVLSVRTEYGEPIRIGQASLTPGS